MYHGLRAVSHYTSVLLLLVVECVTCVHDQGRAAPSQCIDLYRCTKLHRSEQKRFPYTFPHRDLNPGHPRERRVY